MAEHEAAPNSDCPQQSQETANSAGDTVSIGRFGGSGGAGQGQDASGLNRIE